MMVSMGTRNGRPRTVLMVFFVLFLVLVSLFARETFAEDADDVAEDDDDDIISVVIGVSLSLKAEPQGVLPPNIDPAASASRQSNSRKIYNGLSLWKKKFGTTIHTYPGEKRVRYTFRYYEDYNNVTVMQQNYQIMSQDPNITVLIGPIQTDFTLAALSSWSSSGPPMISTSSTDVDFIASNSWSFSLLAPYTRLFQSSLPVWIASGVRRIAYITEDVPTQSNICNALPNTLTSSSISVVATYTIPTVSVETPASRRNAHNALDHIKTFNPDVVVICAQAANSITLLQVAEEDSYMPKAFWFSALRDALFSLPQANYIYTITNWSPAVEYPADAWFGTPADFTNMVNRELDIVPDLYVATSAVLPIVVEQAVSAVFGAGNDKLTPALVRDAIANLDIRTFFGNVDFTLDHMGMHDNFVLQLVNGQQIPVAPLAVKSKNPIYPVPSWQERTFILPPYFSSGVLIHLAVLSIICSALICIIFICSLVWWRRDIFTVLFLLGATIAPLYPLAYVGPPDVATCTLRGWPLNLGYIMAFGALTALAYYERALASKGTSMIHKTRLLKVYLVIIAVLVFLLLISSLVVPSPPVRVRRDPLRPALDVLVCRSVFTQGGGTLALTIIIFVYFAILSVLGVFFSYRIYRYARRLSVAILWCALFMLAFFITQLAQIYGIEDSLTALVLRSYFVFFAFLGITTLLPTIFINPFNIINFHFFIRICHYLYISSYSSSPVSYVSSSSWRW
eukprot:TRINITY_DN6278_c0_g2_i2.p1 TRINITY_DN6278_c0_g2~~TRINITY_DN6278_c0_g2_i2.p1  ORF type:complete len:738 (-),score=148.92 TRINITY_DN6278_c0_g2_i2:588-2801(-)